jgi:DNA-binding transcriptional regulator PaaX
MIKRNSKPYKILKNIAIAGGFLVLSSIAPAAGAKILTGILGDYFRKNRFEREKFLRDLKRLQHRELINFYESENGGVTLKLTKLGREIVLSYKLDEIKLNKNRKWDGVWRLIMFDIPHEKKAARDAFRQKILSMGFYPIQKSAFLIPYECENEIDFIASIFNIRNYILIFNVKNFEGETKLRNHFRL